MSDKDKIKEVIRYMKACIKDTEKIWLREENKILRAVYKYPLEILGDDEK